MPKERRETTGALYARNAPSLRGLPSSAVLQDRALTARTAYQYFARLATLIDFLSELNLPIKVFTIDLFGNFLLAMQNTLGTHCYNTANGYRAAILHYQRTRQWGIPDGIVWAASEEAKKMVAGYGYNNRATSGPKRATMEPLMFATLLLCINETDEELAPAVELAYRMALRPQEVCSLQGGSFSRSGASLRIPDKRATARNRRPHTTHKKVVDKAALAILESLNSNVANGESYFNLTTNTYRTRFLRAVARSGIRDILDKRLIIDGPHVLRHGGMTHVEKLLKTETGAHSLDGAIMKVLQVSKNTLSRYTKTNPHRINASKK